MMTRFDDRVIMRVPEGTNQRADALIEAISNDPKTEGFGKVTRSTVLRLAVIEGLKVLEKRYNKSTKG